MIIILIVILLITYSIYKLIRNYEKLPPGPIGWPIIGSLPLLDRTVPYKSLTVLSQKYGPIYGLQLGNIYAVILSNANLIRDAFKRDDFTGRAPLFVTHGIMGGHGLICAEGDLWRDQRKLSIDWLKLIGMSKLSGNRKYLENRILNGVDECIQMLDRNIDNSTVDILHHTLGNIMNDIVFGVKYDWNDNTWKHLQHLQEEGVKHIGVSGILNFLPILRFLPANRKILSFLVNGKRQTHDVYNKIIDDTEKRVLDNSNYNYDPETVNILELFIIERNKRLNNKDVKGDFCSMEQLRHLLADLFGAGLDTTLATLRWFLLYIAKDLKIQNKIQEEIKRLNNPPILDDYNRCVYLKACLAETQRIRPIVPMGIPHGTVKETILSGYRIPKNTMIMPLQWAIHMNPEWYSNPEQFIPDRFIDSITEEFTLPNQFIPFQVGKRMCLGEELARNLLFLFASRILYNFTIDPIDRCGDMTGECGITLVAPNYRLKFTKINK